MTTISNMLLPGQAQTICRMCRISYVTSFVLLIIEYSKVPTLNSVGRPGSKLAQFERDTWQELQRLASNVPEAGIHFQGQVVLLIEK